MTSRTNQPPLPNVTEVDCHLFQLHSSTFFASLIAFQATEKTSVNKCQYQAVTVQYGGQKRFVTLLTVTLGISVGCHWKEIIPDYEIM